MISAHEALKLMEEEFGIDFELKTLLESSSKTLIVSILEKIINKFKEFSSKAKSFFYNLFVFIKKNIKYIFFGVIGISSLIGGLYYVLKATKEYEVFQKSLKNMQVSDLTSKIKNLFGLFTKALTTLYSAIKLKVIFVLDKVRTLIAFEEKQNSERIINKEGEEVLGVKFSKELKRELKKDLIVGGKLKIKEIHITPKLKIKVVNTYLKDKKSIKAFILTQSIKNSRALDAIYKAISKENGAYIQTYNNKLKYISKEKAERYLGNRYKANLTKFEKFNLKYDVEPTLKFVQGAGVIASLYLFIVSFGAVKMGISLRSLIATNSTVPAKVGLFRIASAFTLTNVSKAFNIIRNIFKGGVSHGLSALAGFYSGRAVSGFEDAKK